MSDENEPKTTTEEWSYVKDKTHYLSYIEKLRELYNKCIAVQGGRKEGHILFNDALYGYMASDIW